MKGRDQKCMGFQTHASLPKRVTAALCERFRALPEAEALREYAKRPEVRNVQTKMILGIYRYADRADASLDVGEAIRRLRECFPFVGLQERWGGVRVALLADDARRGPVQRGAGRGQHAPGAYDREMVRHLDDRRPGTCAGARGGQGGARRRAVEDVGDSTPGSAERRRSA